MSFEENNHLYTTHTQLLDEYMIVCAEEASSNSYNESA